MRRDAEIAVLRAAITEAEDQMAAGFAEQIALHDEAGAVRARLGEITAEPDPPRPACRCWGNNGAAGSHLCARGCPAHEPCWCEGDGYWADRFCGGDPR